MTKMFRRFSASNFHKLCDGLGGNDPDLGEIITKFGYPPMWSRPNSFETLVHFILEQQVSLASARAALEKLRERILDIRPELLLSLSDEELKACYFSRQKIVYVRALANSILDGQIDLKAMEQLSDSAIREKLLALKGIGHWTIDIYLIFVLHHTDIFPIGDLAVRNAMISLKKLPKEITREDIIRAAGIWKPNRTIASMLLWHYYLQMRSLKKSKVDHPEIPSSSEV